MKPLLLSLLFFPSFSFLTVPMAIAQPVAPLFSRSSQVALQFTPPPPPPDRSAPGGRGEGASRGCATGEKSLMALVPAYEQANGQANDGQANSVTQVWGLTTAERPGFWFYVPYEKAVIQDIEFVLQTDGDETLYRSKVNIPSQVGLVRVQPDVKLETGKKYHWFFKVKTICAANQPVMLNYVEGWVQRQALAALSDRLTTATPQQRASLYAENGIWYDALDTLAEAHFANPNEAEITQDWTDLLRAIGLENLADQKKVE
jgi:Domain of Unknown Function (DUF928)